MKLAHTKPATDKTLEQEIQNYVSGEVKLGLILSAIYIKKVENKLSEAETEEMLKTISANPEQYGYPKGLTNDQLRNTLIDNAMRNTAINYIADNMMVEF